MKSILYIEMCNFVDYPLGGHLSCAVHLVKSMKGDMDIAGISTSGSLEVGTWHILSRGGYDYGFYNIANVERSFKKPLIPTRISDYFLCRRHIEKILLHKSYDIIIVQTPEVLMSLPKSSLSKVCLILPGVANPLKASRFSLAKAFAGIYDKVFFRRASRVFMLLPAADRRAIEAFLLRSKGAIEREKVHRFPTRYDADVFNVKDRNEARSELGLANDELVVVTTGRLAWVKGWELMIDAFAIFHDKRCRSKMIFVGNGEDEAKIKSYVVSKGLQDVVILVGAQPLAKVAVYLNSADLFVMGSYSEGWSTSLVEAVACGCRCVVTDFSSAEDLVEDGMNGFIVKQREKVMFAAKMEQSLGLNQGDVLAHSRAIRDLSVQNMRSQLEDLLSLGDDE